MKLNHTRREIKSIDLLPLINVVFLLILICVWWRGGRRPTTRGQNHSGRSRAREAAYQGAPSAVSCICVATR
jgi:hypothetical protein